MPSANSFVTSLDRGAETAFTKAVHGAGGVVERDIYVAGCRIRLRFAGDALLHGVIRALRHHNSSSVEEPDLTVHIWDGASTQSGFPALPEEPVSLPRTGKLVIRSSGTETPVLSAKLESGIISLLDTESRRGFFFVPDAACLPESESGAPLLSILHGWFSERQAVIAHAAAVGTAAGGVLLAGRGGSGKSTAALSCVQAGLDYLADDYCLVTMESGITAHCLFGSAKVDGAALKRLGLQKWVDVDPPAFCRKTVLFVNEQWPQRILHSCPIRAVLLPRIGAGEETYLEPVTAAEALRSLAPSTILQLPGASSRILRLMARIVQGVPCYTLGIGRNPDRIADIIRELLEELQ